MLTDARGVPLGLVIDGANRHDMKLAAATLASLAAARPAPAAARPQGLCLDKAYDFPEIRALVTAEGYVPHIRARGEEKKAMQEEPGYAARRWVVERTHSWMNRSRGLLTRWSKKADNHLALLHFVCGLISCRAAGLFG